jgi:peroxiredoxin
MVTGMDGETRTDTEIKRPRRKDLMAAPFVPVVLAIAVALGVRYWPKPEVPGLGSGDPSGKKAPDFALFNAQEKEDAPPVRLSKLVENGPVMVTFIPTFGCKKCLLYLEALTEQTPAFKTAGLEQIVVISPWAYEDLRNTLQVMDPVPFSILSDFETDHYGDTAAAFGMADEAGFILYGTFVIDRNMRVQFADKADEPFTEFAKLVEIARKIQNQRR